MIRTLAPSRSPFTAAIPPRPPFPAELLHPVSTVYYGQAVSDPYRALEQLHDPAVDAWFHSEAAYTNDAGSSAHPERAPAHPRSAASTAIAALSRAGDTLITRAAAGRQQRTVDGAWRRLAAERVLVDPDALRMRPATASTSR